MRDQATIERIFAVLAAERPEPQSELVYQDPFTLLVAVVLSGQATDRAVNKATVGLFAAADTPARMLALGEDRIRNHISSIGLFNSKARNIAGLSRAIMERHDGQIPDDLDALCALPGVGEKTAKVVLNIAFGHSTIAVDTHIFRVARRIGLSSGRTPGEISRELEACIPAHWRKQAHHWLILHGRYVCRARKPDCGSCSLFSWCEWKGGQESQESEVPSMMEGQVTSPVPNKKKNNPHATKKAV